MSSELNYSESVELTSGHMHSTVFVVGVGQMGPDLAVDAKVRILSMRLVSNGTLVELRLKAKLGNKTIINLVPITNFTNVTVKDQVVSAPVVQLVQPAKIVPFTTESTTSETNS
jgi:hypothetical protein